MHPAGSSESGQSVVILTLVFVGLLAFTALAVDAGLAFVRSSQFSAAVDAAALAGVVDLDPNSLDLTAHEAYTRTVQFLTVNGWPTPTLTNFESARSLTTIGIPQYTITVTWPVDFFFAKLVGLTSLDITHSATAAYYSQAEILVPTAGDDGRLRLASQYTVGEDGCTAIGDPVIPLRSGVNPDLPNENYIDFNGVYRYRIRVPLSYSGTNTLRVELFDPDSRNQGSSNTAVITHTQSASYTLGITETGLFCSSDGPGDSCVIRTGELLDGAFHNPLWFLRVDENWNENCDFEFGNGDGEAVTTYELYYLDEDGKVEPLSEYTVNNDTFGATDLKWVVPGVTFGVTATLNTFDIDITNVPVSPIRGYRFVYLDVTSTGGTAKNVWDLYAGPPPSEYVTGTITVLEEDVNLRNLQIANMPYAYGTEGIFIEALGRMPTQYHVDNEKVTMPLTPIDISLGASAMYVRHFDYDISAPPPLITFTIDTLAWDVFRIPVSIVDVDPDPTLWQASCDNGSDCDNSWSYPQYGMGIPSSTFAGGILQATFVPHLKEMVWSTSVTAGRPFLTK
jgi:hypothetical protein